jgi:tetratricopeptide (TPR) repeat protein
MATKIMGGQVNASAVDMPGAAIAAQRPDVRALAQATRLSAWGMMLTIAILLVGTAYIYWAVAQLQDRKLDLEKQVGVLGSEVRERTAQVVVLDKEIQKHVAVGGIVKEGVDLFARRDYQDAAGKFDRALALDPKNPLLLNLKGYSLLGAKEPAKAAEALEASLKLEPDQFWPQLDLANAYWMNNDKAKAVAQVGGVLQKYPKSYVVLKNDERFQPLRTSKDVSALITKYSDGQ